MKLLFLTTLLMFFFLNSCSNLRSNRNIASKLPDVDYQESFKSFSKKDSYPYIPLRKDLGEKLLKNEKEDVSRASEAIAITIRKRIKKGIKGRGDHSTSQGCYPAEFTVLSNLSEDLSQGLMEKENQGKSFKTVIRFSNSEPKSVKDLHSASLGMAVKVYLDDKDYEHYKRYHSSDFLLGNQQPLLREQDFLTGTSSSFAFKNIHDYSLVFAARANPNFKGYKNFIKKHSDFLVDRGIKPRLRNKDSALIIMEKRFWSSLPYAWGKKAARYSFRPCHYVDREQNPFDHKDKRYQRKILNNFLSKQDMCYEMATQLRPDSIGPTNAFSKKMLERFYSIENSKLFWPDETSKIRIPFIKGEPSIHITSPFQNVARIIIKAGTRALPKTQCEKLVFNPWNGLMEHQPLSSLSRGRLSVYIKSKETRYKLYQEEKRK